MKNINVEYLQHDYYTDIISFNYNEGNKINSDIYISVDRVQENSIEYGVEFSAELRRVIIHGILHLVGHNDESETDKKQMRTLEDECLALYIPN